VAVVDLLKALFSIEVDLTKFDSGVSTAEKKAEASSQKISGSFNAMGVAIAAGLGANVIPLLEKFIGKLEESIKQTAEWGLEMEHLSARMGLTATQGATLVGVMERFGINAGVGARSLQILAMEVRQANSALDPFQTKLGRVLGSMRDANGATLNMQQVFDLARQKVAGASSEMERLQIAQSLVGARMGGQLLPILKLSNEEWAKVSESVMKAQGDVEKAAEASLAYKQASVELQQNLRGISVELGSQLLPKISEYIGYLSRVIEATREFGKEHPKIGEAVDVAINPARAGKELFSFYNHLREMLGLVNKGTADAFDNMDKTVAEARKLALEKERETELEKVARENAESELANQDKLTKLMQQRVSIAEKMYKLGVGTAAEAEVAREKELLQLAEQRAILEDRLAGKRGGLLGTTKEDLEEELAKNRLQSVEIVAQKTKDMYAEEEAQLKARGALNLNTEIELLQRKLSDEHILGEERLKIEGDLYQKRRQYEEQIYDLGRKLGATSVKDEIELRKRFAAEALGKGDITGAVKEILKARDLAVQQADNEMNLIKKLRLVSLQDEIDFQTAKLKAIKGNAEEEMKVIGQIADLDKQQYEKRLELALNYTKTVMDSYRQMTDAMSKGGETMTFAQARVDAERKMVEETRTAASIGLSGSGGTEAQRNWALQWAQMIEKQILEMQQAGKSIGLTLHEADNVAQSVLKAASGGEDVRAPGGPSPTVGSILSPIEGLATQGLARGSDIPRLDTSFTDLAVRIRDVLLGTIPNIQSFSVALASATARITGGAIPPGGIGPGGSAANLNLTGPLSTSPGSPAPSPSSALVTQPAGSSDVDALAARISQAIAGASNSDSIQALAAILKDLPDILSDLRDQLANAGPTNVAAEVGVTFDPDTQKFVTTGVVQQLTKEIST
jgi:hypothetical protein